MKPRSKPRRAARRAWEAELARQLGPRAHAHARAILNAEPRLAERATEAELRQPGSGAFAAALGLRGRLRP